MGVEPKQKMLHIFAWYIVRLVLRNKDASRVGLNFDFLYRKLYGIALQYQRVQAIFPASRIVMVSLGTVRSFSRQRSPVDRERAASSVTAQFVTLPATESLPSHST